MYISPKRFKKGIFMIQFDYDLSAVKVKAITECSGYVSDVLPQIPENLNYIDIGFRAIPKLIKVYDNKPVMAHIEAGYFISKMCINPTSCYDEYIERLIQIKEAEEQSGKSRFISVEDFVVSSMVRIYALFYGKINVSDKIWAKLKQTLINTIFAQYFEPMSENHKLCFLSSELICAALFKDDVFYDGQDGKTRMVLVVRAIKLFLEKRLRRGWGEYDSASYYEIDFMSLINIYDFSPDEYLKKLAFDCLNVMTLSMYIHSAGGNPGGPKGRVYPNVIENPHKGIYSVVMLGFEKGKFVSESMQVTGMMYMATSSFMFDRDILDFVNGRLSSTYEVKDSVGLYTIPDDLFIKGKIYKYFYKGENYCMGCVIGRDNPYENVAYTWLCAHQEQGWSLTFAKNPKALIYSSHPGNPELYDYGMHSLWTGDCNCLCQRFVQDKNTLLCYWNIVDRQQLQYIHIYLPEAEFDKVEYAEKYILANIDNIVVKILIPLGYEKVCEGNYKDREIRVNSSIGCFSVDVILSQNAKESAAELSEFPTITNSGAYYKKLKIENGKTYVNGKEFDGNEYMLYNSPYLKSEYDSGKIKFQYKGCLHTYGIG